MSMKLEAPYPGVFWTTILPSPEFSDVEKPNFAINIKRAIDSTRRTYVKQSGVRTLTYMFRLTRAKALELRDFVEQFYDSKIKLTNHKDEIWFVTIVNNPFEASAVSRAIGSPGNEDASVSLSFEGTQ